MTRSSTRSWRCSKTQKPLLRDYTEDDIGDFIGGQLWMTQAWSGDWVQMTYDPATEDARYVIPSEGAIRGSDVMVVTSGAQHPIAAHLWIDFNLDAEVSAANSNYIGYMGPNAAAQASHRPGTSWPTRDLNYPDKVLV